MCCCVSLFPMGFVDADSGPHVCTASTLLLSLPSSQIFNPLLLLYNKPLEQAAGPSPGRFFVGQSPAARVF